MTASRVLLVDDEAVNRDMLSRRLARRGYAVGVAASGAEALEAIDRESWAAVLLDVQMPGMSGLEVLQKVRERWTAAELPVLMVTAKDGSEDIVAALDLGANDYVTKPVDFPVAVARLRTQRPPDGTAYERLTAHGPTALLPRGDGHYGLVHGVQSEQAEAVAAMDDAAFLARVQDAFGWRAGRFLAVGPRSVYPIIGCVAEALVAPRAVLVGNAAQSLHPLGAQGFNLGLRDALTLAECIAAHPGDAGDDVVLRSHAARRAEDRSRTLAFSDGLAKLTSNDAPLLRPLRSAGLLAGDAMGWLQGWLVGGAMGYRGDVPALCRKVAA